MTGGEVRHAVRGFITGELMRASEHLRIGDRDDLITAGVIDSMGIMHLIGFLESTFAIRVRESEILPENFSSVEAIASFVARHR
ncbi:MULTISPECIES: acyl carrier protein [Anaeromyxobacter]|uniref:acyl carrier protein n=1 Tax=Anaeromyxobacter TaxID=161492 RepID=UPI001F5789CE|nr:MULTISPECIES: acyl carrier protein [unclassified Anaeromyxobacter]